MSLARVGQAIRLPSRKAKACATRNRNCETMYQDSRVP